MRDPFFEKDKCDRCHGPLGSVRQQSMFNEDCLCMKCKDEESKHPKYRDAVDADNAEIRKGNYNFKGIGYPGK